MAIAAVASLNSFGAAILWSVANGGIKGVSVAADGTISDSTANIANGADIYFYLGTTSSDDVKKAFGEDGFVATEISGATLLESATTKTGGKAKGSTPVSNAGISSSEEKPFFAIVVTSLTADDESVKHYFKLLEGRATGYETSGDPLPPPTSMSWTANQAKAVSWTAVPEPATAALALLGLGLMIKRRKA